MAIDCIIIEDEPLALERTQQFVQRLPHLNLQAAFENALDALAWLRSNRTDLLFLDINMDELSGIQLLESAKIDAHVIFTTAYPEYALKGYELNVTDYLLKPFTFERFVQAVDKVQPAPTSEPSDYLFVKTENRLEKLLLRDILYIEGMRDYRRIHTPSKRIMTLQTFAELEQRVPREVLCRVHKSYMVGIANIDHIERSRVVIGSEYIPISDGYRQGFFELIGSV